MPRIYQQIVNSASKFNVFQWFYSDSLLQDVRCTLLPDFTRDISVRSGEIDIEPKVWVIMDSFVPRTCELISFVLVWISTAKLPVIIELYWIETEFYTFLCMFLLCWAWSYRLGIFSLVRVIFRIPHGLIRMTVWLTCHWPCQWLLSLFTFRMAPISSR